MPTNTDVFDHSIKNSEPLFDPLYRNERIIISDSPGKPNALMEKNGTLIEQITAYKVAMKDGDRPTMERIITTVLGLLRTKEINVSEFVTFWATLDVSFSAFGALSDLEKRTFLRSAIETYINLRHTLYARHGYSATTLQVRQDSFAHKVSGEKAMHKMEAIFQRHGFTHARGGVEEFLATEGTYIFPDASDSVLFDALLVSRGLAFTWGTAHQGKRPDAAFVLRGKLFLL